MNEESLSALMVADTDVAPAARIDLDRVVRDGRRRRRRRAVLLPSVAAAVVVVLGIGVTVAVRPVRDISGTVEPGAAVTEDPDATPAPAEFRLDRFVGVPTWFPYGLIARPVVLSRLVQQTSWAGPDQASEITITVYAAGVVPWPVAPAVSGRPELTGATVSAVNGRLARWYQDGATGILAWRWATGGWATVAGRLPGADLPAVLREVATNIIFFEERRVSLPFTMAPPPAPWSLAAVRVLGSQAVTAPTRFFRATVDLSYGPEQGLPPWVEAAGAFPEVAITVSVPDPGSRDPQPTTTIAGHPAAVVSTSDSYSAVLYDVSGFRVEVAINGATALGHAPPEVVLGWAMSVIALPRGVNEEWSSTPFR